MNFAPGQHPRESNELLAVNLKVVGLGGAGINVVDKLAAIGLGASGFLAVDTDAQALQRVVMAHKVPVGAKRTRGLGCGGDPDMGRQCVESAKRALSKQLEGAEVILMVAGLGGGMGTGAGPALARMAVDDGALVLVLALMPFECEGRRRMEQARAGLARLRETADAVICLPNQHVLELHGEDQSAQQTFEAANALVLQGVFGLGRLLRADGLLTAGLADLRAVLAGHQEESVLAAAEAGGRKRHRELMDNLCAHPFMENGRVLKEADALLVSLVGGLEMSMADVNKVTQQITANCPGAEMVLSAAVEPGFKDKLGITVITARGKKDAAPASLEMPAEAEAPEMEKPRRKSSTRRRKAKQQELQLQDVSKGRFEKGEPTLHEGEDLDVPTYIRRNLALK
jgi:cell division protein FtsZ